MSKVQFHTKWRDSAVEVLQEHLSSSGLIPSLMQFVQVSGGSRTHFPPTQDTAGIGKDILQRVLLTFTTRNKAYTKQCLGVFLKTSGKL